MVLNMIKLCVGVDTVEDLESHVAMRLAAARAAGLPAEQTHRTRVTPKRADEILAGGSLYWVIKGNVQLRQPIRRFDAVTEADGIERCHIVLEPVFQRTAWQPRRAFQGWRYLTVEDAPPDLGADDASIAALPPELRRELAALGLL